MSGVTRYTDEGEHGPASAVLAPGPVCGEHDGMEQLETRTVYQSAWITVREDRVARCDGSTGTYGVGPKAGSALVIPSQPGGFWLVERYRYPIGRRAWEFPQGSWAAEPGGEIVDGATIAADAVLAWFRPAAVAQDALS